MYGTVTKHLRKEGKIMKKVIGVIVVLCILIAVIENGKEGSPDVGTIQNDFEYSGGSGGTAVTAPGDREDSSTGENFIEEDYIEDTFMEDNFIDEKYPCLLCNGNGVVKCRVCDGTGENSIYDSLDSIVLKAFEKPYCEACDGKGAITCGRCNGSGMD